MNTEEFRGPLAARFREFEVLMRSTGGKHTCLLSTLRRLDRFLEAAHPSATTLTKGVLIEWFASFQHLCPVSQSRYRTATFQVCKFLQRREPGTAGIREFEPIRCPRSFRPHVFTHEEVLRLLSAARKLASRPSDRMRPWSLELVVVLLYTAGLRIGEVVRLQIRDYDANAGTLVIRETKFAKTRLVPLSLSARRVVESYLLRRRELGLSCVSHDPLRCCPGERPPSVGAVQSSVVCLMRQCGIKPPKGGGGPRIHDMRHTFALERVRQWYREGRDVQALLPRLATYMGHRSLESTQLYLSVTPAILQEANARFEAHVEDTRRAVS